MCTGICLVCPSIIREIDSQADDGHSTGVEKSLNTRKNRGKVSSSPTKMQSILARLARIVTGMAILIYYINFLGSYPLGSLDTTKDCAESQALITLELSEVLLEVNNDLI